MKLALKFLYVILIFLAGFVFGQIWNFSSVSFTGFAVNAPSDFVDNNDIIVYPDKVVIEVSGAQLSSYGSTGSMLPVLGTGVNGINIVPASEDEIQVGNIITFRSGTDLIVHRVIEKGTDEQGVYFITKGDNSPEADGKIRFSEVERILVGLIY